MGLKGWLTKRKAKMLQKESQRQALRDRGQTDDVLPQDHLQDPIAPNLLPPMPEPIEEGPYTKGKKLGEGAFGTVHKYDSPGKESVVKKTGTTQKGQTMLQKESEVMDTLGEHPNIVQKSNVDTGGDGLTMEMLGGGDMQKMFDGLEDDYRKGKISHTQYWGSVQHLTRGTLEGVQHMGDKGLIHGDLKPGNVMIDDKTAEPKLIDFGSTGEVGGTLGAQTAMINSAPEHWDFSIPKEERTGAHVNNDVYAVGQMMYRMGEGMKKTDDDRGRYGHMPEGNPNEFKTRVHRGKLHEEKKGGPIEDTEGKGAYGRFVNKTMDPDPDKRLSAKKALQEKFLTDSLMQEDEAKQFLKNRMFTEKTAPPPAPPPPEIAKVTATKQDRDNKHSMHKELLRKTSETRHDLDDDAKQRRGFVKRKLKRLKKRKQQQQENEQSE